MTSLRFFDLSLTSLDTLWGYLIDTYTPAGYEANMDEHAKSSRFKSLNRIEGQVRGLSRMVEEDR